ncbi:restriction endonuclease [Actinotalea sp. M2MS4P-6]|uniref:restriction endonuclease n=1 Tax=Actinotalea sp. M2MS4P-6 TaxID=2983762 RepID=UPI0021E37C4E|nr:restriction endonuclease [Actinotalea sp. M2MS4P-6]MCV2393711.1 restriction endonuclease [Actinotalea sp. M2MS4P-6]
MVRAEQLSGYLLEEVVAHLLQGSGYRLLAERDDPVALVQKGNGLRVRGRGAEHQADALGQLNITIPFSLPIRLFVEAKNLGQKVGLDVVRNAHGVVHDVNEFMPPRAAGHGARGLRRVQYRYSVFSTSGFSADAQDFALAHQISLVDLSGSEWGDLARLLRAAADDALRQFGPDVGPSARSALRGAIRSSEPAELDDFFSEQVDAPPLVAVWARDLARRILRSKSGSEDIFLGFVDAPFLLALRADDTDAFVRHVHRHPGSVRVHISYERSPLGGDWVIEDVKRPDSFRLTFPLPGVLERVLLATPPDELRREASFAKKALLSTIVVYVDGRPVRLMYERVDARTGEPWADSFEPVAEDAHDLTPLRVAASRPSTRPKPMFEDEGGDPGGRWEPDQIREFLDLLHVAAPLQERLIRSAASRGGYISRGVVYEIAHFEPDRTLRGLTRPTNRLRRMMIDGGRLHPDASFPLKTRYDRGVRASGFEVPPEFVEFLE